MIQLFLRARFLSCSKVARGLLYTCVSLFHSLWVFSMASLGFNVQSFLIMLHRFIWILRLEVMFGLLSKCLFKQQRHVNLYLLDACKNTFLLSLLHLEWNCSSWHFWLQPDSWKSFASGRACGFSFHPVVGWAQPMWVRGQCSSSETVFTSFLRGK